MASAEQGPISGSTPLLPIQQMFFELDIPRRQHWNQSVLLEPGQALDGTLLETALQALLAHHDALRLGFRLEDGTWCAEHRAVEAGEALLWQQSVADGQALEALAEQAQRSLDLGRGPLLRALLATLGDGSQRLLLVIHHLAVDGVSWRILLEDLQTAYRQLQAGQAVALPAKTSAFKAWAERLQAHARDGGLEGERGYWLAQLEGVSTELPCDDREGAQSVRHVRSARTELTEEATRRLLQEAPAAYRTQVNDLLLTALARVIGRWTGQADTLIQLEGHGREELFEDIDLTRTVGWFTSLFPLRLSPVAELGASIKRIKEQLRAIPHKGLGFGALRYLGSAEDRAALAALPSPRITFNYLGQFDGSFSADSSALFRPSADAAGSERDSDAPLDNWLSLNGQVYAGRLGIDWSFSAARFSEASILRLADAYRDELLALIEHCCAADVEGVTPSDFPWQGSTSGNWTLCPWRRARWRISIRCRRCSRGCCSTACTSRTAATTSTRCVWTWKAWIPNASARPGRRRWMPTKSCAAGSSGRARWKSRCNWCASASRCRSACTTGATARTSPRRSMPSRPARPGSASNSPRRRCCGWCWCVPANAGTT